ncbi:MAG: TonB-dependent receptor [Bacteroidales bacterium]
MAFPQNPNLRISVPSGLKAVLLLLLFSCVSLRLFAQNREKFNIQFESSTIKHIFSELAILTGYEFAYSDTEINSNRLISVSARQKNAEDIIQLVALKAGLEARFAGKKVILKPLKENISYHISGVVSDSLDSQPLPGVSISLSDASDGVISDANGKFNFDVPFTKSSIRISSIGYTPWEGNIYSDTILNIRLQAVAQTLSETIVVAFGKEPEDLITGSVSHLEMDLSKQLYPASLNATLQSEITGLQIQANGGTPGSSMNVTIRGISSITAGRKPLYVIDGIPVITGDYSQLDFSGQAIDAISDISVNDIESVSVLKDAAASSLFGSNSSNGIILINTKRGLPNQNSIELYSQFGFQQTTGMLDMLNANQWMNLMNEQAASKGNPPVYSDDGIRNNTIDTDWQKEVFRRAPTSNLGLSIRGGTQKSRYYISGNFFNQEGIIIGSDFRRYNLMMNYDYQINKRLSIETGNTFAFSVNNRVEGDQTLNGPLPNAISMPPVYPVYNNDGTYNNDGPYANPVSIAMLEKNLAYTYRNTFHFKINYELFKNFIVRSLTGLDYYNLREETFAPKSTRQGAKYNGLGIEATSNSLRLYQTFFADYTVKKSLQQLDITAGLSFEKNQQHDIFLRAQNFAGSSFEFLQDAATPIATQSYETNSAANSLFTRIKYSYNQRYVFTLNMRYDGSSKFGENNRFGFFPSVSGLWYVSKEAFFKNQAVTKLIFSTSYGITGNDQIGDFMSLNLFSAGSNYGGEGGISPTQLANPDLKWESTNQFNLGAQFDLFNKVSIRADYYYKKTKDLLLQKPMPTSSGYAYIMSNIGKLQNQGFEALITAPIIKGAFCWDAIFNFSANRNKVLELYEDQPITNIGRAGSRISVGEPVSYFYGFKVLGVNPDDGNLIYEDLNKDGKITDLDREKIGSPHPDFFGGIGSTLSYKGLYLDFMFSYSYGNDIFNSTRIYTETISQSNQTTAILRRWQKPGDITDIPKASVYNQRTSSRFVEDGSYIRLKNIRLSYELPSGFIGKAGIKHLELFVAGKNLITFTPYSGMDPEVNYNGLNSIALGTDFFTCPQFKSLLLGLCARF